MKNYTKLQTKFIEDIKSNVTVYEHNKTGARVCTIENDDNNKVFSIAFRTPPINNGGLTHILEHSVLCGSKNYPVKDPFVELIKGSLNTFLNAFTFPDKTMYPCASKNDKDFKNLMSVYMDAVFYPQIYAHEEIFMQEGWHYHILDENDAITYNGVVYNEMKGAFSDPQQVLIRNIMHSLFPDTPYGLESGGDPKYIPDLNYEEFKEFHSKFYHPTNSYIFLYGDCDMEERMNWLHEAYLKDFDKIDFNTEIPYQEPFKEACHTTEYYPIPEGTPKDGKTFLSYNVAFPSTLDTKKMIATNILVNVLLNNPGAPLKQTLIDANLGADVAAMFDDGLLQPILAIIVMNSNEEKEEEFINLVNKSFEDILNIGLDHEALLSLIKYAEFKVREGKFSYMPKGLEIEMTALSSWLYDEAQPFNKLENLKYYEELKQDVYNGYFEDIIKECIINNTHKSYAKLVPSYTCAEEKEQALTDKLAKYKESLSKEELASLIEKNKALQVYQSTPSTPEEIATLPKLGLEDLNPNPEIFNLEVIDGDYTSLVSDYFTNDISYVTYSFDISKMSLSDLPYVKLLTDLCCHLNTSTKSFQEINQLIQKNTGGVAATTSVITTVDNECKTYLDFKFSATKELTGFASELVLDLIKNTDYHNEKRFFERLSEIKTEQEMGIANRGHVVGLVRSASYFDETMAVRDTLDGLGYADFIMDLFNNWNDNKETIMNKLDTIISEVTAKGNFLVKFTGTKNQFIEIKNVFDDFYSNLNDECKKYSSEFKPVVLNEGIKTQYDVNYVARSGKYSLPFDGGLNVLSNALSLDYLWMQVRVHGGAYGCMLQIQPNGIIGFTSYRDPNLERTNKVYEDVVEYISNMNPSEDDLLKYKIGAIGSMDPVLHVSDKGAKAQRDYLAGLTYDIRKKRRLETLSTTVSDLRGFAKYFEEALSVKHICVVGNANKVEEAKELFDATRNLIK